MAKNWANGAYNGAQTVNNFVLTPNGVALRNQLLGGAFGNILNVLSEKIAEITYFNLNQTIFNFNYNLWTKASIGVEVGHSKVIGIKTVSDYSKLLHGFYMGSYKHTPTTHDFTEYEPYTSLEIYLPYYGYASIPIRDIFNKYIYFRLVIDFQSCSGTYFIYANNTELDLDGQNHRFLVLNLNDARLISTYSCTVGVKVPITTNGSEARVRDSLISLSKEAVGTVAGLALGYIGGERISERLTTASPITTTYYTRSKKSGRMIQDTRIEQSGSTLQSTTKYYRNPTEPIINGTAESAKAILGNFTANGVSTNISSSVVAFADTQKIHIIVRKARIIPLTNDYKHLYGLPLGETASCDSLSGYTKFSNFRMRNFTPNGTLNLLGYINTNEFDMICDLMLSGVYF